MALLCLLCRKVGHKTADCPEANKPRGTVVSGPDAAVFAGIHGIDIYNGKVEPSPLCARCSDLKIIDLMIHEDVKDCFASYEDKLFNKALAETRNLGTFRSIELLDSCPLCRMIFGAFPAEDPNVDSMSTYLLFPFSTCNLTGASLDHSQSEFLAKKKYNKQELDALRQSYSVLVYIVPIDALSRSSVARVLGQCFDDKGQLLFGIAGSKVADSVAGTTPTPPIFDRKAGTPRPRSPLIDFNIVNGWLEKCNRDHGNCQGIWRDELMKTRMLDVCNLKLVDCPPHCQYVALSYVWGDVVPEPGALQNGTLPPTIMDAMEVTRRIGLQYLWVDALCIDQRPTAQKMEQIRMMDRIYEGAYVTIVALHGNNSLHGLPGVTYPKISQAQAAKHPKFAERPLPLSAMGREIQPYELVDGYPMTVAYPVTMSSFAMPERVYTTRAWTLQEHTLSRRQLLFDHQQVHFNCNAGGPREETIDDSFDPAHMAMGSTTAAYAEQKTIVQLQHNLTPPQALKSDLPKQDIINQLTHMFQYTKIIRFHSSLHMTDPRDALNTIMGLISSTERLAKVQPFVWGLPLRDYPLSLTWYHDMRAQGVAAGQVKITRRKGFPSWSHHGWYGEIDYNSNDGPQSCDPDLIRDELGERQMECGMCPAFVSIKHIGEAPRIPSHAHEDGHVLTIKGYRTRLEIQTDPFSEAFLPGTGVNIGLLLENNHLHPISLPNGVFDFVVAYRLKKNKGSTADSPATHTLYLIMLDDSEAAQHGGIPSRQTLVRWTVDKKFSQTPQYEEMLCYDENIRIV